ncbi:MAG: hypothetical protein ACK4WH_15350 [Phycisphaerales bacterium]
MTSCVRTVAALLALCVIGLGGATAQTPVVTPEARARLEAQVAEALKMQKLEEPGHGERLRTTAWQYSNLGLSGKARDTLALVIAKPESDFDLAEAYRMSAQAALAMGDMKGAIGFWYEQLRVYDQRPGMKAAFSASYCGGVSSLATTLLVSGRLEEALAVNDRLLGPERAGYPEVVVTSALVNRSTILSRMKRFAEAAAAYDDLFNSYPRYGVEDGSRLRMRLRRVDLIAPDANSPEHLAGLLELWNDPQSGSSAWSLDLAICLSDALRGANRTAEAIEVERTALQRLDARRDAWTATERSSPPGSRGVREIRDLEVTLLSKLSGADAFGRPDAAMFALVRLLPMARSQLERDSVNMEIARVGARLGP